MDVFDYPFKANLSVGIYHITRKSHRIQDLADPAASVNLLRFEKSKSADETDRRRQAFFLLLSWKKKTWNFKLTPISNVKSSFYGRYRDNFH